MAKTVLLSVQQESLRFQIREFLASAGYHVLEAFTDADTTGILQESPEEVDLLLADRRIESAIGFVREVARVRRGIRVLFISGDPEDVNRMLLPDEEVGFIEKPFAWRELRTKIDDLLAPASLVASYSY